MSKELKVNEKPVYDTRCMKNCDPIPGGYCYECKSKDLVLIGHLTKDGYKYQEFATMRDAALSDIFNDDSPVFIRNDNAKETMIDIREKHKLECRTCNKKVKEGDFLELPKNKVICTECFNLPLDPEFNIKEE